MLALLCYILLALVPTVFAFSVNSSANPLPHCQKACNELSTRFHNDLYPPENDDGFVIWDAKQLSVRPACRVQLSSPKHVADIMRIVVDNWCRFAVKGGGHSRHPDDSNSIGGVTIDLGKLNSIQVLHGGTRAIIGGGADSGEVYSALAPSNLSFVGGRVASVGIGGYTPGGGTSAFANKHGWALDNVYGYELCNSLGNLAVITLLTILLSRLANSTVVAVSETNHPDLYYALRGGSNNFGIVTAFTVRVFHQDLVFNAHQPAFPNTSRPSMLYTAHHHLGKPVQGRKKTLHQQLCQGLSE